MSLMQCVLFAVLELNSMMQEEECELCVNSLFFEDADESVACFGADQVTKEEQIVEYA